MTSDRLHAERPDLDARRQIHALVVGFYREIVFDDLLGPVFGVVDVDWAQHIPKLIDYWCRVLLGEPVYNGYVLAPHQHVHELEALRGELFDRRCSLWIRSVDDGWCGPLAEKAKAHGARMAATLSRRILGVAWTPPRAGAATRPVAAT